MWRLQLRLYRSCAHASTCSPASPAPKQHVMAHDLFALPRLSHGKCHLDLLLGILLTSLTADVFSRACLAINRSLPLSTLFLNVVVFALPARPCRCNSPATCRCRRPANAFGAFNFASARKSCGTQCNELRRSLLLQKFHTITPSFPRGACTAHSPVGFFYPRAGNGSTAVSAIPRRTASVLTTPSTAEVH